MSTSTTHSSAHSSSVAPLCIDGLSVHLAGDRIITDASFTVSPGQRTGLIGENGSGKSTLLHAIHGSLPSSATVTGTASIGTSRVGLLYQQMPFAPDHSVATAVESAVAAERDALAALAAAADPFDAESYARALDIAEQCDAWGTDARISATLAGLGLSGAGGVDPERLTGELSGGQQARLSLAWLLLNRPDILLLDEPTNHLDASAVAYLSSVLSTWRGPVLFASHDRDFLDLVATDLIDLDPAATRVGQDAGITRYTGNYSDYLHSRQDARSRWERTYQEEQAELRRLRAGLRDNHQVGHANFTPRTGSRIAKKFYGDRNAKVVSRRVNDSRSRLATLEESQVRRPPAPLTFAGFTTGFTTGDNRRAAEATLGAASGSVASASLASDPVVSVTDLSVTGRLASVSVVLGGREKLLVVGSNGSGKSTFLGVLAGSVTPDTGTVSTNGTRIGILRQEVDLPDPAGRGNLRTAARAYRDVVGDQMADAVPLSTFGLVHPRDENRPLSELSLGTQRRVALAALLADPPEVLLLDEPDNHFSLSLVTALEETIPDYPGAVVVASHDRWLQEHWTGSILDLTRVVSGDGVA